MALLRIEIELRNHAGQANGKLIVAEGGEISGDVRQLDGTADLLRPLPTVESDSRPGSGEPSRGMLELNARGY
jgi:hypothetical protein